MTMRYVITHIGRDGLRRLTLSAQGRDTFATAAEAAQRISDITANNSAATIAQIHGTAEFAVRHVECWPGHFDPKRTIWED